MRQELIDRFQDLLIEPGLHSVAQCTMYTRKMSFYDLPYSMNVNSLNDAMFKDQELKTTMRSLGEHFT